MKAVQLTQYGGVENMYIGDIQDMPPGAHQICVQVMAAGINRADTLQRQGKYFPPAGESSVLGLEVSGVVVETGEGVTRWKKGDRVCGLLSGGGYAEYVCAHEGLFMPIPKDFTYEEAAAFPEAYVTAYQALVELGRLQPQEWVCIHAGGSGVGSAAIQLAKYHGAKVVTTASGAKLGFCTSNGADYTIDYQTDDFADVIQHLTNSKGVNLIVDVIGGSYWDMNIRSLALDGRLVCLSVLGGHQVGKMSMLPILQKRLTIYGSTLRSRSLPYRINLIEGFTRFAAAGLETEKLKPCIDSIYPWEQVAQAHQRMENNENQGKIVLQVQHAN